MKWPSTLRRWGARVDAWDRRGFDDIARRRSTVGDATLPRLTRAADHSKLWGGIALGLMASRRRRPRRAAARGLGSIAVASLAANQIGKRLAPRTRPSLDFVPARRVARRVPTSSSFPSGHSASAAAFATGVALEIPELAIPLAAAAVAVGYSRVYTGVHYPSDVAAGAAVGVAAAAVVARVVPLPEVRKRAEDSPPSAEQPPRPTGAGVVAVINPNSGKGDGQAAIELLRSELPDAEIVELGEGDDLAAELRKAAPRAEVIAVAGGDGSINAGAQVAMEANKPLLVLPAGTLNHFAGDLGEATLADAIIALREGSAVCIDIGWAQAADPDGGADIERVFLNTASVGAYPEFVAHRERWERRLGKPVAAVLAVLAVLRTHQPLDLKVNDRPIRLGLAFIGSNAYEPRGFLPGWRPDLAEGRLDVRLLDLSRRYPLSRFALALFFGRVRQSRQYFEQHVPTLELQLPGPDRLSVDGEIVDIGAAVRFDIRRAALTVFRPRAPAA
jgi:undecaprenyl-diphosphatase